MVDEPCSWKRCSKLGDIKVLGFNTHEEGRFARGLEEIEAIIEGVIDSVVNPHFAEGRPLPRGREAHLSQNAERHVVTEGSRPRGLVPCPLPPLPPSLDNESTSSTAVRMEECESEEGSEGEECEEAEQAAMDHTAVDL
eukprot:313291-Prymnesium_polylepis.1